MVKLLCLACWCIAAIFFPIALSASDLSRPNPEDGPTDIRASIIIVDFDSVRDADQSFEASVFFNLSWHDPRLEGQSFTSYNPQGPGIWIPQVGIANQQNAWPVLPTAIRVEGDGTVSYSRHVWGTFSQPLNLLRFPFDTQTFKITLVAAAKPGEIRFLPNADEPSGIASSTSVPDWTFSVEDAASESFYISEEIKPADSFVLKLRGDRLSRYYVYTMILPLIVIAAMSFVAFWIEPGRPGTRIGIASTSMLTVITYRVAVSQIMPRTNYFTDLDIFIAGSTVLVFLGLLFVVVIEVVIDDKMTGRALKVDKWLRIAGPFGLAAVAYASFG